jgi:hypothetical protein
VPADPQPWWLTPAIIAALVAFLGTLATIAYNGLRARRDRQREMFARAFAAVADYWEFPYVVRRRRPDQPEAERVRISEALRDVQSQLSFYQAWIAIEAPKVASAYEDLVSATRRIMGGQIHEGWNEPPARSDAEMNISGIRRNGLQDKADAYLAAVRDHLVTFSSVRRAPRHLAAEIRSGGRRTRSFAQRTSSDF